MKLITVGGRKLDMPHIETGLASWIAAWEATR
jgi:hypothetical protein